jgi:hypothetical protein
MDRAGLSALGGACIAVVDPAVLGALGLEDMGALSSPARAALDGDTLITWARRYGNAFVEALSPPATPVVPPSYDDMRVQVGAPRQGGEDLSTDALLGLKAAIAAGSVVANFTIPDPAATAPTSSIVWGVSEVTSLQLSMCTRKCMTLLLASDPLLGLPFILQLPLRSYRGLRGDQLGSLSTDIVALVSPLVWSALPSDALGGLTGQQVRAIPTTSIASVNLGALSVSNGAVAALTADQIVAIPSDNWSSQASCALFNSLSKNQRGLIAAPALESFEKDCSGGGAPQPPSSGGGGNGGEFSTTELAVSVAGTAAGTLLLCVLAYCCCLRTSSTSQRHQLSTHSFKPLYNGGGVGAVGGGGAPESSLSTGGGGGGFASNSTPRSVRVTRHHPHAAAAYKDASPSLRQPLSTSAAGSSPLVPTTYPPPADDAAAEDDDLIGSRF